MMALPPAASGDQDHARVLAYPGYAPCLARCALIKATGMGPRNYTGETVIRLGAPIDELKNWYDWIEIAATLKIRMPCPMKPFRSCLVFLPTSSFCKITAIFPSWARN